MGEVRNAYTALHAESEREKLSGSLRKDIIKMDIKEVMFHCMD
jgi:hypothetical protein